MGDASDAGLPSFLTGAGFPEVLTDEQMKEMERAGLAGSFPPPPQGYEEVNAGGQPLPSLPPGLVEVAAPGLVPSHGEQDDGSPTAPATLPSGMFPSSLPGETMRADSFPSRILGRVPGLGSLLGSAFESARSGAQQQAADVLRGAVRAAGGGALPEVPGLPPASRRPAPGELLARILERRAATSRARAEEMAQGVHTEDLPTSTRLAMEGAKLGVEIPKLTTELAAAGGPVSRIGRFGVLGGLEAAGQGATPAESVVAGLESAASVVPFEAVGPLAAGLTVPGPGRTATRAALTTGVMAGVDIAHGAEPDEALIRAIPWGVEALRHGGGPTEREVAAKPERVADARPDQEPMPEPARAAVPVAQGSQQPLPPSSTAGSRPDASQGPPRAAAVPAEPPRGPSRRAEDSARIFEQAAEELESFGDAEALDKAREYRQRAASIRREGGLPTASAEPTVSSEGPGNGVVGPTAGVHAERVPDTGAAPEPVPDAVARTAPGAPVAPSDRRAAVRDPRAPGWSVPGRRTTAAVPGAVGTTEDVAADRMPGDGPEAATAELGRPVPQGRAAGRVGAAGTGERAGGAGEASSGAAPIGRQDITAYIAREFELPIRVGHFQRKALGLFKVQPEVVRTAGADDITTTAHELGHALHKRVLGLADPRRLWSPEARRELVALGRELYGDRQPEGGYAQEGFAEFLSKWMAQPEEASARAPKTSEWFQNVFLAEHPDEARKLTGARALFERWRGQGAEARILGQIDPDEEQPRGVLGRIKRAAATGVTDRFEGIRYAETEMLGGRTIEPAKSPYLLARATAETAGAKARHFVMRGVYTFAGRKVAPGLAEALAPVAGEIRPFLAYAYGRRALELHERGIDPGVSKDDAAAVVAKYDGRPEFRQAVAGVKTWANALVDYLADAGGLSAQVAQRIKDSSLAYIPLKRVFSDVEGRGGAGGRGFADLAQPVKRLKGSGRAIQDPLEALIEQAERIISTADRARVARALVDLAEATPGGGRWAERVDLGSQAHHAQLDAVARQLEQAGADLSGADRDAMLTFFTNAESYFGKENIVSVYRDGKRVFYELDPELYRAMKGLDGLTLPWFIAATAGRARRAITLGATGIRAGFQLITNPLRDTWEAVIATQAQPLTQPFRALRALVDEFKGAPHVERWKAAGGQLAQPLGIDRSFLQALRQEMLANTRGRRAAVRAKHPIETLREVLSFTEAMNRIAEFKAVEQQWGAETENAQVAGAVAAADLTVDFRRAGVYSRVINQVVPFFNPAVQGISRNIRLLRTKPVRTALRAVAGLTAPALALWWLHKDEDWWQELPLWERVSYLHFKPGDEVVRVPLPFEFGYEFAALPVAVAESIRRERPDELAGIGEEIARGMTPGIVPGIVQPAAEAVFNYDLFRQRPVEGLSLQRLLPEERAYPSTPSLYRYLGRKLGVSPVKLEHVVNGYTGGFAADVVRFRPTDVQEGADLPVLGRLFSRRNRPGRSVDELYEALRVSDEAYATIRRLRRDGRADDARETERAYAAALQQRERLRTAADQVRGLLDAKKTQEATTVARRAMENVRGGAR